ncbi:glycosyltransferase family 2 protein [Flavisolibacter tropicus]|uniref:Glycosyltransferase 2-like domain-containing protein n=1 Tax=Flavisolibacter tropicus TaxID=1492898 RepID=A0A172TZC8_9BACT|nr:glycosyltransferase family A protein [Flavisolibacter tropicus]ANE52451.1 hypothetical protein SY85_20170 [Flavisolibacter tropicus]
MTVSVIIPTYNGGHKLPKLLKALEHQTFKGFELLIVVDGSTDSTIEVLKNLQSTLPFTVIEQTNKGRAAVRNNGAKAAKGQLLIFFDDDMMPLDDCVEKHFYHHQQHPVSILTGGLQEPIDKNTPDFSIYKSFLSKKWTDQLESIKDGLLKPESIFLTAANFSISRQTFLAIGGFDEQLFDAEDFDLAVRAAKAGVYLYFKPNVFAWHHDIINCSTYIRRQRQYTMSHQKLVELKPWLKKEDFIRPLQKPEGFKRWVFLLFCFRSWIKASDKGLLRFLPKKVRYRVYDLIVTANGVFFPEKVPL